MTAQRFQGASLSQRLQSLVTALSAATISRAEISSAYDEMAPPRGRMRDYCSERVVWENFAASLNALRARRAEGTRFRTAVRRHTPSVGSSAKITDDENRRQGEGAQVGNSSSTMAARYFERSTQRILQICVLDCRTNAELRGPALQHQVAAAGAGKS